MDKKNIVVIGASGQVGSELYPINKYAGHNVVGTYKKIIEGEKHLDLCSFSENDLFINDVRPNVIYLPAAITNVDYCETHPKESYEVNVSAVKKITDIVKKHNIKLVFYSTDYIFDGKEGLYDEMAKPNPINEYGKQKLEAEQYIQNNISNYLIIRTCSVYSFGHRNFVRWVIDELESNKYINVCIDEWCTPILAEQLALYSHYAEIFNLQGVFNIAGKKAINKYKMALAIANKYRLNTNLIVPIKSSDLGRAALRPLNAGLDCSKFGKATGYWGDEVWNI